VDAAELTGNRPVKVLHRTSCFLLILISTAVAAKPAEVQVAVASNFAAAMDALAHRFEATTDHELTLVLGSTGKQYAQIRSGAPFDFFLAADSQHPTLLESDGLAVPGSRFTYAIGHLVLWSPQEGFVDAMGEILGRDDFRYLAIANPQLAPYGRAAREVLVARRLWERLEGRMVRGENIAQAFQFVKSGNADMGFVALSQLTEADGSPPAGSVWMVPQEYYTPIVQQGVLLEDTPAGREFAEFLQADEARAIIRRHGYTTP